MYKIAVDAMGGDDAPTTVVSGVESARDQLPNVEFILFGQLDQVKPLIQDMTRISLIQSDDIIAMADEPVKSIRNRKNSSLVMAANAVKHGEADALFSAGNTGALLAAGIFLVGRIKGISRPALMTLLPAIGGEHDVFVMMDVGANADNRANHLYEYGILGSFYAHEILHYENPRVGLLNNGGEEDKGDQMHKDAHQLLKTGHTKHLVNFVGNVEAANILQSPADVVVSDGFTGNAALKAIEGTAKTIMKTLKNSLSNGGVRAKMGAGLLLPTLKSMAKQWNPEQYGGAVVLGVKAPVVKAHGSASPKAIAAAMVQIESMLDSNLINKVDTFVTDHKDDLAARMDNK
ncbi:phosphate acyltransferase PlsX [Weissella coleopterorum]|uniref:Phosphate acyltransferase n=1 Tax=Weissella coleopterorum TaxID=2714949 RepID=A0A6G8B0A7_9LACO|nr:phosphate acyltransferase PlsX [Weissella coleopterorum]QIL50660.1 phosphate acyltransferase PlsX [Weissella coleopterorum]